VHARCVFAVRFRRVKRACMRQAMGDARNVPYDAARGAPQAAVAAGKARRRNLGPAPTCARSHFRPFPLAPIPLCA
jgi:hypothetical protein